MAIKWTHVSLKRVCSPHTGKVVEAGTKLRRLDLVHRFKAKGVAGEWMFYPSEVTQIDDPDTAMYCRLCGSSNHTAQPRPGCEGEVRGSGL